MKRASAFADALWTELIGFQRRGIGGEAVDGEVGHLSAQIIGDIHGVEAGGTAGLQTLGLGGEDLAPGGGEKGDGHLLGNGDPGAVAVGGHCEGEVRQGEDGASHGNKVGI